LASKWGKNDHNAADRAVAAKPNKVFRAVFGLPLKQSFRSNPPGRPHGFDVFTEWKGVSRFASPLHIKVGKLDSGFCVLLVFFDSHTLPAGTTVELCDGGKSRKVQIDHGLWNHMKTLGPLLR
jgi:CRISPR/Cas system CMR-associated protein Cmr1 (group 7 of RAMP superfamily)